MAGLMLTAACSSGSEQPTGEASRSSLAETSAQEGAGEVPLVTLRHWKESTPNERYAFLIGFVTMLELEKEWQGKDGRGLLPFDQSLINSWVEGFAYRPLTEMYNEINNHLARHPGDQDRAVAEVMWFTLVKPRLDQKFTEPDAGPDAAGQATTEP